MHHILFLDFCNFIQYIIAAIPVIIEFAVKEIREEQEFQYKEDDGQLNKKDDPQAFSGGHFPEPVKIKGKNSLKCIHAAGY
jgi:hypothetical protein